MLVIIIMITVRLMIAMTIMTIITVITTMLMSTRDSSSQGLLPCGSAVPPPEACPWAPLHHFVSYDLISIAGS